MSSGEERLVAVMKSIGRLKRRFAQPIYSTDVEAWIAKRMPDCMLVFLCEDRCYCIYNTGNHDEAPISPDLLRELERNGI